MEKFKTLKEMKKMTMPRIELPIKQIMAAINEKKERAILYQLCLDPKFRKFINDNYVIADSRLELIQDDLFVDNSKFEVIGGVIVYKIVGDKYVKLFDIDKMVK